MCERCGVVCVRHDVRKSERAERYSRRLIRRVTERGIK